MKKFFFVFFIVFNAQVNAEVSQQLTTSYFDIVADDIDSLVREVKKSGPEVRNSRAWAILQWDLNTEYYFKTLDDGCQLKIRSMDLIANVILPKWKNISENKEWLQNWWSKYLSFIKVHENGHFDIAISEAKEFEKKISNLPTEENCTVAKSTYLTLKHDFLNIVRRQDRRLDNASRKRFFAREKLFRPLNAGGLSMVFESGGSTSYIGL